MDHKLRKLAPDDVLLDALIRTAEAMRPGDNLVLDFQQTAAFISEVIDKDNAEPKAVRPRLFFFDNANKAYLNPAAVALIIFDNQGNAVVSTVSGAGMIKIEALQWQFMQEQFREAFEILVVKSTGGLVSA
jgi:hypothetical protein